MYYLVIPIIILLLYILCVLPNVSGKARVEGLYTHRGLYLQDQSVPENSLAAFKAAKDANLGIELDLQLSADGIVYVFHDHNLTRLFKQDRIFSTLNSDEIDTLSLNGHGVVRFEALLQLIQGKVPLIIEFKSEKKFNKQLPEKAMELLKDYPGSIAVESFDPRVLIWFKKHHPELVRGQLVMRLQDYQSKLIGILISTYISNLWTKPDFMAVECHISEKQLSFSIFKRFKGNSVGWTITPETLAQKSMYDAIIFEHCPIDELT